MATGPERDPSDAACHRAPLGALDVVLVLGVGAAAALARTSGTPLVAPGDGLHHVIPWAELLAGHGYTIDGETQLVMPPGYGLIAAPFLLLFADPLLAGALTSLLAYLAGLVLATSIAHRLRPGSGPLAGLMLAISPMAVATSDGLLTEPTFTAVLLLAAALGLDYARGAPATAKLAAVGALGGLLYLVRPEGLLAAFALPLGCALARPEVTRSRRGRQLAVAWLAAGVVVLPYLLFLRGELGYWTLSGKSAIVLAVSEDVAGAADLRDARPELFDPRQRPERRGVGASNAASIVRRIPRNVARSLWALAVNTWYAVVVCLALRTALCRSRPPDPERRLSWRLLPWWIGWTAPLAATLPFFIYPRFVLPYVPAILVAVVALVGALPAAGPRRYAALGGALGLALLLLSGAFPVPAPPSQPESLRAALQFRVPAADVQRAGTLFAAVVGCRPDTPVLLASRDRVTFAYAACRLAPWPRIRMVPPDQTLATLAERARAGGEQWIVGVDRAPRAMPTRLELDTAGLIPVARSADGRIAIYQLR